MVVDKSKAIKQGVLTKQGAVIKNWKKRHCVISHGALLYYKANSASIPQGGLSLCDAAVTFAEGVLQVRSPMSFTNVKGRAEEARDRVFKFKGEPAELKDWLYQLTATKNQLMDRVLLKPLVAKLAELEKADNVTEELVFQYQTVIERTALQVTSASQGVIDEHKAKCAAFTAKLGGGVDAKKESHRKAPGPPSATAGSGSGAAAFADAESSEDEFIRKPDTALVAGLDEALKEDSKVEERVRAPTRDESSAYMDMANEVIMRENMLFVCFFVYVFFFPNSHSTIQNSLLNLTT